MDCVLGIDIGSGHGTKIGVYDRAGELLAEGFFSAREYTANKDIFCDRLTKAMEKTLRKASGAEAIGLGIACPGLFSRDGTCMFASNLPFLSMSRPSDLLSSRLGVPAWLINDAAAGGMAEWFLARHELVYWALGGGWGGTWMGKDGKQVVPSLGWSGNFDDLDCINEPGFTIPVHREEIEPILHGHGLTWADFAFWLPQGTVNVKDGSCWMRAEAVTASCIALRRIFLTFAKSRPGNTRIIEDNPDGRETSDEEFCRLAEAGFDPAVRSEYFFVDVWAVAIARYYSSAAAYGLTPEVPVHLGGGLACSADRYLPRLKRRLSRLGIEPTFILSHCHLAGKNANLLGAARLAIAKLSHVQERFGTA